MSLIDQLYIITDLKNKSQASVLSEATQEYQKPSLIILSLKVHW